MSQMSERHCPTCGISITADQRFCTNCGTVLEAQPPPPSQYGAQPPSQSYPYSQQTPTYEQQPQQMQPYAQQQVPSYAQSPQQQVPPYAQQQQPQNQSPIAEAFGALGLLFLLRGFGGRRYAGYRPQRQRSSCCGCLVLLVVLFLCLGVPSLYYASKTSLSSFSKSLNYSSSSNSSDNSSSSITTQPPITTAQINQTVPYAGVDITIVNAQQSKAFLDDRNAGTTGVVRLNLKEDNKSTARGGYLYGDVTRLILPDKTSIAPTNEQQFEGPDAGVSRTNWLDFPVPTSIQIGQLTLQLGKDTEAQEMIALTGKANVTQYQTKTTQLNNVTTQYAGLTWTVTSATVSLGYKGQQAGKGMQYVTVSLKVDNPSSQGFSGYWGDYLRLKSGTITSPPSNDATLPLSFAAGSSGSTGDVNFIMPAGSTSYILIFLSTASFPTQSTVNFQTA